MAKCQYAPGKSAIIEVREVCLLYHFYHVALIVWNEHWSRGKNDATIPMLPPLLDERTNDKLYRTISFINSAQSRQGFFAMLKEQYGEGWLEQKRADIMPNPARWLANGLIDAYWRNKSGIEDIHAGEWEARPLLQRRITPMQEYTIVQKVAEGIVPSMHAIYNVVNKKSENGWEERALSLAINFSPPDYWSLTERTAEVMLEGAEP